jgi:hypothetical protein
MEGITEQTERVSVPAQAGTDTLPCLRRNNSIEKLREDYPDRSKGLQSVEISKGAYKTEYCLKTNIELAAKFFGLEHLVFFTLTFAYAIYSAKRAQKYLNSLLTNVIRPLYGNRYIAVMERHKSGAIHFHFILWLEKDVRTGFDWTLAEQAYEAQKQKQYARGGKLWAAAAEKAVNGDFLRKQWGFWRGLTKKKGTKKGYRWLGRCEMLPIKSTAEAIARYTGSYIGKHMQHRRPEDKGVRLVRYGKGMHRAKSRLAFNSPKGRIYRRKLAAFATQPHIALAGVKEYEDMKRVFGKKWGYHLMPSILAMELDYYPNGADARADGHDVPVDATDVRITWHRSNDPEFGRFLQQLRRAEVVRRMYKKKDEWDYPFSAS